MYVSLWGNVHMLKKKKELSDNQSYQWPIWILGLSMNTLGMQVAGSVVVLSEPLCSFRFDGKK